MEMLNDFIELEESWVSKKRRFVMSGLILAFSLLNLIFTVICCRLCNYGPSRFEAYTLVFFKNPYLGIRSLNYPRKFLVCTDFVQGSVA